MMRQPISGRPYGELSESVFQRIAMRYLLLGIVAVAIAGVALCLWKQDAGVTFQVGIRNQTGSRIDAAAVTSDHLVARMGVIVEKGQATYGLFPGPAPSIFNVTWISLDGQSHAAPVRLRNPVPRRFAGTIYFTISPDGTVSNELVAH
jgi:hypothetical protein